MAEDGVPRAILDSEYDECIAMLDTAFEWAADGYFQHYFYGDPWFKNRYCRVYSIDGRIVSSVQICRREVRVGCSRLVLGGIGNVGTLPDYRGNGHSSELLKDSVKVMDEDEMDFSFLYTGIHGFYERVGWRKMFTPYLTGKMKKSQPRPESLSYTIRPYQDDDAAALLRIYDQFNEGLLLSAFRTEPYWKTFCLYEREPPLSIMLAERESLPVAYTVSRIDKGALIFDEAGILAGHELGLDMLLRMAANDALDNGIDEVHIEPATHPYVMAIADGIADDLDLKYWPYTMVKFFNLERTFKRLLPELSRRAKAGHIVGSVSIDTEIGSIGIRADGERVTIVNSADVKVHLTQPDLGRLIFGIEPPKDEESDVPETAAGFLERLFPVQPFAYWQADMF